MTPDPKLRNPKQPPSAPRPGRPVRGSASGRPLLAAFDLLGRRWALRVVWELRDGPLGARELRARCDDVSPSVLYDRLRELVEAGLVEREARRYTLSETGASLEQALRPLTAWADHWADQTAGRRAH